mmetsp:Transcript_59456/g.141639  ORF Transcript_59456/g.141639 Transcript_59456/m.141639 type:complete len:511 (+) Transcript_59456:108-1640(+)
MEDYASPADGFHEAGDTDDDDEPRVYGQRWVQLAYLAALALLSDWVCFSVAAIPDVWFHEYQTTHSQLVDIFLFTNVLFCLIEPAVVAKWGLRNVVVGSSFLMSVGCVLRSGLSLFTKKMPWYWMEVLGTLCVGAAQPFFQCTPTLLSAVWFAPDERVLATSIAINSNQIGIGVGFLLGASLAGAGNPDGLNVYFSIISFLSLSLSLGAYLQFQDEPPSPPSNSAAVRTDSMPTDFPRQIRRMLRTPGFLQPLATFMASIGITNAISTKVGEQLKELSGNDARTKMFVMLGGAGFQMAIMLGSVVLGKIVDVTKWYKSMVCVLMVGTMFLLVPQGGAHDAVTFLATLFLLGSCVGPVQPISAELAVEVAFPLDENAIVAFQQVCGNLFSAMSLPVLERAVALERLTRGHFKGGHVVLEVICISGLVFFATFHAPLKRAEMDARQKLLSGTMEMRGFLPIATPSLAASFRTHGIVDDSHTAGMEPLLDKGTSFRFTHTHSMPMAPEDTADC